jgi:hypothetical protein
MREQKIKKLQNNLMDLRNKIHDGSNGIVLNASIEIE